MDLYKEGEGQGEGKVKFSHFTLDNTPFSAMDGPGNHDFSFNEGVSFVVECDTQEEIDYYWEHLSQGGKESQCGWLKDRFGVSWQVVPRVLSALMSDAGKARKVTKAFMTMQKLDIEALVAAAEQS
jgi:predicted 3-demethylubiquinone-9 3-methyltransferase (glyoxalase superfamily)